jgi:hypothetical protein
LVARKNRDQIESTLLTTLIGEAEIVDIETQVSETSNTNKNNEGEITQVTAPNNTNPYDKQAREMGWRPKEEWEGEPEKWRDAKEFVERGELYGKIDSVGRELKETRKALKMLQEHHSKVRETEFNRAVEELKAAQKKHLEDGNADEYLKATELLTDIKAEQKARKVVEETTPKSPPGLDPRFVDWTKENSWYERNTDILESLLGASSSGMSINDRWNSLNSSSDLPTRSGDMTPACFRRRNSYSSRAARALSIAA